MKHFILPLIFLFGIGFSSISAQIKFSLKEENRAMSAGSQNALVIELPNSSAKEVGNAWKDFIKKYKGKTKYDKRAKEYFTDNTIIKGVSDENNTIDVYAKVEDKGEAGSEIAIWFNLGGTYLSQKEHPDRFEAAKKTLEKFTEQLSADMFEDILKEEEKKLKDMEKELKDMEKDKEKREKDIRDYKDKIEEMNNNIADAEGDIKENLEKQGEQKKAIDDQSKVIDELKAKIKKLK